MNNPSDHLSSHRHTPFVPSLADRNVGLPVRFGHADREAHCTPPLLGEHTEAILREAGYADTEIQALRAAGALGATPTDA